jgi:hypothetical protein
MSGVPVCIIILTFMDNPIVKWNQKKKGREERIYPAVAWEAGIQRGVFGY